MGGGEVECFVQLQGVTAFVMASVVVSRSVKGISGAWLGDVGCAKTRSKRLRTVTVVWCFSVLGVVELRIVV